MSEKRFTFGAVSPNVAMIKDNGEPMDIGEVVNCLNEQQATIDRLTQRVKSLNNLLTTEVVPNLIFLHGAIVYGEEKDFSSLIDKIEKEVQ